MIGSRNPLLVMSRLALVVAVADWLTKAAAARLVAGNPVEVTSRLRFAVFHNEGTVLGWSAGAYTWELNLALTLAAILFMIPVTRELARIDASAPRALGLIMGGALGNFASLALSPPGVVDFISIAIGAGSDLVVNVADIAAYLGLAMIARTGFLIVAEIRRSARVRPSTAIAAWPAARAAVMVDREVSLPVAALADVADGADETGVPRPESVRQAELAGLAFDDPKVIDIRPRLARRETASPPRAAHLE